MGDIGSEAKKALKDEEKDFEKSSRKHTMDRFNRLYSGLTQEELEIRDPSLYQNMIDYNILNTVPKKNNKSSFQKTLEYIKNIFL